MTEPKSSKYEECTVRERYYDPPSLPFKHILPPTSADPKKGETAAQMQHVAEVAARKMNTSIDEDWEVNPPACADYYVIIVMLVVWLPKFLAFVLVLLVLLAPPVAVNYLYTLSLPQPLHKISLDGVGWKFHVLSQWLLSLPAQIFVALSYTIDILLMAIFGSLYCTASCGWARYFHNRKITGIYAGGPNLYAHFEDCVAVASGMVFRQGYFEFLRCFSFMFLVNPWVKYWLMANIYVYNLGERYINQVGQAMDDMDIVDIDTNFHKAISRAKHNSHNRKEIDAMFFCPHYPYPPPGRQYAIGMQQAKFFTTFVHTTHFRCPGDQVFALSTSVELPVYRVMLWYNNPFHIYTGYVEASIGNGLPSQPEKKYGGEHPMWILAGHNWVSASRKVTVSTGWIDWYFDRYIPWFQRFIRGNVRGWDVAEEFFKKDPRLGYETARTISMKSQEASRKIAPA